MGKENGFAKGVSQSPFDPEYVKLQREEVVKGYQDRVIALKNEIKELEGKKASLEEDVKARFASEAEKITILETQAKARKQTVDEEAAALRSDKEAFLAYKEREQASIAFATSEIEKTRASLECMAQAQDKEAQRLKSLFGDLERSRVELSATKKELEERILSFQQDRLTLEAEQLLVKSKKADQDKRDKELETKRLEIESLMEKSKTDYSKAIEGLNALEKKELELDEREIELNRKADAAESVRKEAETNLALAKADKVRLEDLARQLQIREKVLSNETAIRKRELDEREERIKTLEKGI